MGDIKKMGGVRVEISGGNVTAFGKTNDNRTIAVTVCDGVKDAFLVATTQLAERIKEANDATHK